MPVYEYVCQDCNTRFQKRVATFKLADSVSCESCSGSNIHRTISKVAFLGASRDIPVTSGAPSAGGCCGGSCGCRGHA
jgi:putative FmdB family regulatory protein